VKKPLTAVLCLTLLPAGSATLASAGRYLLSWMFPRVSRSAPPPSGAGDSASVVRSLESRYHSARTLKAAFLERYTEGGRNARVESGTVYFRRPGRMRWEYESPEEKLFIADGQTVWFYVPADRTVTRARTKESADWRTPLALLTGNAKLSRLCGRIEFADERPSAADHVLLRCLPRGNASRARSSGPAGAAEPAEESDAFREVLLEVDPARSELLRVLVRQAGGLEIEYRFGNWQRDLPLPEAMFRFQAPPGVAIVDESSIRGPLR